MTSPHWQNICLIKVWSLPSCTPAYLLSAQSVSSQLGKTTFLHTKNCLRPHLMSVSLIQQKQQACPLYIHLISSGRIYYGFEIKADGFRKRYLSCKFSLLGKTFVRVRLFEKTFIRFLSIMALVTNVDKLPALLDACSSTQQWELLLDSILVPNECNVY